MTTAEPERPGDPARPSRPRRWAGRAVGYVRAAPGTYVWLVVLGVNTFALVRMSPRMRRYFLFTHSTNLDELHHHPVRVLVTSAFWTETPSFLFWFVLFNLFSVPVERRLGTLRWLCVVAFAHVGATLVSEGAVSLLIDAGDLPHRTSHTIDIGVSYALSGAVGVLTWLIGRPLRWWYLGAATLFYALLLAADRDFTNLGHLTAFLLGLACHPLTRDLPCAGRRTFRRRRPVRAGPGPVRIRAARGRAGEESAGEGLSPLAVVRKDGRMADTVTPLTPRRIADAYVDALTVLDPGVAVGLGVNLDDDRQPDLSPEGFAAEDDLARHTLALLAALPSPVPGAAGTQDPADAACARLLRERLTARLAVHAAGDHLRSLSNIASPVHQVRQIFTGMPTATDQDWSVVAGRLRNVPGALQGYRATLTEGLRRGLLSGPRQVDTVIGQLGGWIDVGGGGTSWFADFVAAGPEALRPELDRAAAGATAATAAFRDWLRQEYAPAAVGAPEIAGRELYLRSARFTTGADLDLDEAYAWAWSEFHRLDAEMRAEADRVLPGAVPLQAVEHLDRHGHVVKGVEEIRRWLQQVMDEAVAALDGTHFDLEGPLRQVEAMIAPAGSAAAPYYSRPSLDFSRPGRTWLPTLGRETFPTWQLVSTWYHEGVPGHHLQLAQRMRCADRLSRFQTTVGGVSAEIEGWALYAERFMDELGFFTDPGRRLGFLDEQMLRTIRVVIDIGMHLELLIPADSPFHPGERWTPGLATEFMAAYNGSPAEMRDSEIVRYLGWPGQAIGYKLGERAWRRGREEAVRRRGAAFDLKDWHMKALSQGAFGLDDLTVQLAAL